MKDIRHLTRPEQYAEVFSRGVSRATGLLVMRFISNGLDFSRYGFSISKKVGGAVVRNKIKRQLREIMRATCLAPGWDIVVVARPKASGAGFSEIKDERSCPYFTAGVYLPKMKNFALKLIRFYQVTISVAMPPRCRFTPSCSEYTSEAIKKYGLSKGCYLGIKRLLRCHPFHEQAYDPVP